jgi:hypothetical protein
LQRLVIMPKSRIRIVLEMIKFEHSVFALPFALVGALLAARAVGSLPSWRQILWIVVAMVGARSAAMTMNRIVDIEYDRRNPRTANRALPAFSARAGGFVFLFLYEAIHRMVALRSWILPGNVTSSRLDCDSRLSGLANVDPLCGGDALGRRVRCALRLPRRSIR